MKDGKCNWPRGKVLGGSSGLNAMLYARGNKHDYDLWEFAGNTGWGYEDVLPYFRKSENINIDELKEDTAYHGTGGFLSVEYFKHYSPLKDWFLVAAEQFGFDIVDANGPQQSGFMKAQGTISQGLRCSTAKAFLRPASKRPNLHVTLQTVAEKILIHSGSKKAHGVRINKLGAIKDVHSNKEIILSAGALQSPQLLMLSGVGPKEELRKHNIPLLINSPGVGENLQDHVAIGGGNIRNESTAFY